MLKAYSQPRANLQRLEEDILSVSVSLSLSLSIHDKEYRLLKKILKKNS